MNEHPLLIKAAQHTAQARAINDEFEGKDMPAEAARQMEGHLKKASDYRRQVEAQRTMADHERWLETPDYKHDGGASEGGMRLGGTDTGEFMLESERKDRQQKSFMNFVRRGIDAIAPEVKADLVEDTTGELLVPHDFAGTIFKDVPREAVIRTLAFVRPTTKLRVDIGSLVIDQASWGKLELGDSAHDGLGATPAATDQIRVWDLNCLVKLGTDELDDSDENLEAMIRAQLALKIAEQEDDAFAGGAGDGSKQPWTITHGVTQNVQVAADNVVTADDLKSLKYKVAANFRRNGVYLGTSTVEEQVALLKDANDHYLLQPATSLEEPATFAGKRWYTVDGLPGTKGVVFGDVRQAYMIADRQQLTVQRLTELYAGSGKIGLLFRHRVGGDVIRPKALAYYELDASA